MSQTKRHCLILLAAGAAMFFVNLGVPRLWDVDEAIFSQAAWEMMDRGDWVTPYFNGALFPDKPALTYWAMIVGYKLFGPTEFAARFWSAVCGLGTTLLTYQLGRKLFSPAVGFWGGMILASSLSFGVIARAATPDSLLVFFCTLALVIFVSRAKSKSAIAATDAMAAWQCPGGAASPSWHAWLMIYGVMGLAVLVKGPVGVVLPTAVIGLFLLWTRATESDKPKSGWLSTFARKFHPLVIARTIWKMRPLTALAAVLAVAGPWYVWVGLRTDGQWLQEFFGVHNFGRFLHPMENHRGPVYYYLIAILIGLFPWSALAAPTVLHLVRRLREGHARRDGDTGHGYTLLAAWVVVWVGFFSLASTKLPSYVVPAYPALALIIACFVDHWLTRPSSVHRAWPRAALGIVAVAGLAIIVVVPLVTQRYLGTDWLLGLFGLAPLVGGGVGLWLVETGRARQAASVLAASAVALSIGLFGWAAVRVDRHQNSQWFADVIHRQSVGSQPAIGQFNYFRPSLVFYAKQPLVRIDSPEQAHEFFNSHPLDAFLVTTSGQYEQLAGRLPPDVAVLERKPAFLKPGEVLLIGRAPGVAQDPPSAGADDHQARSAADSKNR